MICACGRFFWALRAATGRLRAAQVASGGTVNTRAGALTATTAASTTRILTRQSRVAHVAPGKLFGRVAGRLLGEWGADQPRPVGVKRSPAIVFVARAACRWASASGGSACVTSTGADVKCTCRCQIRKVASSPPGLVAGFGGVVKAEQGAEHGKGRLAPSSCSSHQVFLRGLCDAKKQANLTACRQP